MPPPIQQIIKILEIVNKCINQIADLLEVVYSKPYLTLSIEHTSQVTPGHGKRGTRLYRFQITCLQIRLEGREENVFIKN